MPTAVIVGMTPDERSYIVECPHCEQFHTHGASSKGYRSPHCSTSLKIPVPNDLNQYDLEYPLPVESDDELIRIESRDAKELPWGAFDHFYFNKEPLYDWIDWDKIDYTFSEERAA